MITDVTTKYGFDADNQIQMDALSSIINKKNVFITGEGGSGKSTFIKTLIEFFTDNGINYMVVAPTGVAANNYSSEGLKASTIHSFFMLGVHMSDHKLNTEMINNIMEVDVIIVDEISMVSAELFDRMSYRLSNIYSTSNNTKRGMAISLLTASHFANKQIILVGDLLQIPPIVKDEDNYLMKGYESPYFFDSHTFKQFGKDYDFYNFQKNYRQSESDFIECLRAIRYGLHSKIHIDAINEWCYDENNQADVYSDLISGDGVYLTSLRKQVEEINQYCFNAIGDNNVYTKHAEYKGSFEKKPPTSIELQLKSGAKVMTLTNNKKDDYINGSSFFVNEVHNKHITLNRLNTSDSVSVNQHLWFTLTDAELKSLNIKFPNLGEIPKTVLYEYIKRNVTNWFLQYPLMVAWAVTIHKSQGMTLDKAYVNTTSCFGAGHTYVALSRVTKKSGLRLTQKLEDKHIKMDYRVLDFYNKYNISA